MFNNDEELEYSKIEISGGIHLIGMFYFSFYKIVLRPSDY